MSKIRAKSEIKLKTPVKNLDIGFPKGMPLGQVIIDLFKFGGLSEDDKKLVIQKITSK